MKISKIYKIYNIPPNLQRHMYRVSSLAQLIVSNYCINDIDKHLIISSCLLHDMGKIIKFDLNNSVNFLQEEQKNIQQWRTKKREFIEKYGKDEHEATYRIIGKIKNSAEIIKLLKRKETKDFELILKSDDYNLKIFTYSDYRIGPFGILTLEERLRDIWVRYAKNFGNEKNGQGFEKTLYNLKQLEDQLQSRTSIKIDLINDSQLNRIMVELFEYTIA